MADVGTEGFTFLFPAFHPWQINPPYHTFPGQLVDCFCRIGPFLTLFHGNYWALDADRDLFRAMVGK